MQFPELAFGQYMWFDLLLMEMCLFKVAGHSQRPTVFSEKEVRKWKQEAPIKNSNQEWNT